MDDLSPSELEMTAHAYEQRLVPALFSPYAERLVEVAAIGPGARVLDVACGPGVVARAAAAHAGPEGRVAGLDVNPGMLAVAARRAPSIDWRQGKAEALPWEDAAFDVVLCQFGLNFFSDPGTALREMWRVLAPGGRLAVAVFDGLERNPAYAAMVKVLRRRIGSAPAEALGLPFSLGEPGALSGLFERAGIPGARFAHAELEARFPSLADMVLADVEGWFPLAGIRPDRAAVADVIANAETALAGFRHSDGSVAFPVSAHIVIAEKG